MRSAYPMMVRQTHKSSHPASALKTMELIDRLMEAVPIYRLSCNMEPEAAKVADEVSALRCKNLKKIKVSAILLLKGGISND